MSAGAQTKPSFDCAVAKLSVDRAVCAFDKLAESDRELAVAYSAALMELSPPQSEELRRRQRDWLRRRNATCQVSPAVVAELGKLRDLKSTITALLQATSQKDEVRIAQVKQAMTAIECITTQYSGQLAAIQQYREMTSMGIAKYPVLPTLKVNKDSPACAQALQSAIATFKTSQFEPGISVLEMPGPGVVELPWQDVNDNIQSMELDFGPARPILAWIREEHSWRGDIHKVVKFPSRAAFEDFVKSYKVFGEVNGASAVFPQRSPEYGPDPNVVWTVFRFAGRIYLAGNDGEDVVMRIERDNTYKVCQVENPAPGVLPAPPEMLAYKRNLDLATGDSSYACLHGSIGNPFSRLRADAAAKLQFALTRPWTTSHYARGSARNDLNSWASAGLWNHRVNRAIDATAESARMAMVRHYVERFGMTPTAAESMAGSAIIMLFNANFWFPAPPISSQSRNNLVRHPVLNALPSVTPDEADAIVADTMSDARNFELAAQVRKNSDVVETPIFATLEQPRLLAALLAAGHDVNHTNRFGKTALMYAFQFDLPKAVEVLISHGADLSSKTQSLSDCTEDPNYEVVGGRTALDYALENSSEALIIRLVQALGKPAEARPEWTQRLATNEKLDVSARARIRALLAP